MRNITDHINEAGTNDNNIGPNTRHLISSNMVPSSNKQYFVGIPRALFLLPPILLSSFTISSKLVKFKVKD